MQRRRIIEEDQELDEHTTTGGELPRYRTKELDDKPNPPSRWNRISTAPLFLLIVGTIAGTFLTYYYSSRQAEIQRQRSFADELNKIRLNKIGEVWEKVFLYEAAVEGVMQQVNATVLKNEGDITPHVVLTIPPGKDLARPHEQGESLYAELIGMLNKDRFWLADEDYRAIKEYADTTYDYFLARESGTITKEKEEKRAQARANLAKTREQMLKEPLW